MTTPLRTQIVAALKQLDVGNDNHWTSEGAPRMETMRLLTGDPSLDRLAVQAVNEKFTRATASTIDLDAEPEVAPVAVSPTGVDDVAALEQAGSDTGASQVQSVVNSGASDIPSEDAIQAARRRIRAAQEAGQRAKDELAAAYKAEEELLKNDPMQTTAAREKARADNVQRYLDTQRAALELKGQKIAALKGIDLKAILPTVAPIDRAFARKTGFGRNRPVFTLRK